MGVLLITNLVVLFPDQTKSEKLEFKTTGSGVGFEVKIKRTIGFRSLYIRSEDSESVLEFLSLVSTIYNGRCCFYIYWMM